MVIHDWVKRRYPHDLGNLHIQRIEANWCCQMSGHKKRLNPHLYGFSNIDEYDEFPSHKGVGGLFDVSTMP